MKRSPELSERLTRLTDTPVRPRARELHLDSIEAALRDAPAPARLGGRRRRWATVALATAMAVLPAGTALAAEQSLPGDLLYPIKRVTETIRSVVDHDVVADHRVDELEQLIERDAPPAVLDESLTDARREVDRLAADHRLHDRLDALTAAVTDQVTDEPATHPVKDEPTTDSVTDEPATDRVNGTDLPAGEPAADHDGSDRPAVDSEEAPAEQTSKEPRPSPPDGVPDRTRTDQPPQDEAPPAEESPPSDRPPADEPVRD